MWKIKKNKKTFIGTTIPTHNYAYIVAALQNITSDDSLTIKFSWSNSHYYYWHWKTRSLEAEKIKWQDYSREILGIMSFAKDAKEKNGLIDTIVMHAT